MGDRLKSQFSPGGLTLLLLLVAVWPAWGREVAGPIQGNTVWEGEVSFRRAIEVPVGAQLEIRAGTRVRPLAPGAGILVRGVLLVRGSEAAPVVFDSPPRWTGIEFSEGEPGSLIEHARFQGALTAVSSSLNSFTLRHSTFTGCRTAVKLLRQSNPRIEHCRFEGNDLGVDIEMRSAPQVVGNHFAGHRQGAILVTHNSAGLIEGNDFTGNRQGIGLLRGAPVRVVDNRFSENEIGLYCEQTRDTPVIAGNRFSGNRLALVNFSFSSPTVENNLFAGNETAVRNDQLGMPSVVHNHFRDNRVALHNLRRSAPEVTRNLVESNEVAIICDYSSYPRVKNNNFLNNGMGVKLGLNQSADWEKQFGSRATVQATAAGRQGPMPMLPAVSRPLDEFVDVRDNWWGKDTALLAPAGDEGNVPIFYDRRDHPRVAMEESGSATFLLDLVEFSPWLEGPAPDAGRLRGSP